MSGHFWDMFLPAFAIPFSVALIILMLRKHLHDLWTPAVDIFAMLLASEGVLLWEHHMLSPSPFGAGLITIFTILLTLTAPLLILSLILEDTVIRVYMIRRYLRRAKLSRKASRWIPWLWGAAIGIFGTEILVVLEGISKTTAIAAK